MRKVNQETMTDTQSYPCKTKTSHETDKSLSKFLEPSHKPKVICTEKNFENPVKTYHGFIVLLHFVDPRQMVLLQEQYAELQEGTSPVLLQSSLDEKWWLMLWNATAIFEMFKTSWQMGKHRVTGDLEPHSNAP